MAFAKCVLPCACNGKSNARCLEAWRQKVRSRVETGGQSDRKRARRSVLVCAVAWVLDCCSGVVSCHFSQWCPCDASHLPVHAVAQELCLPSLGQIMFKITTWNPLLAPYGFREHGSNAMRREAMLLFPPA